MSYEVLARKWRPSHFDEVVGQSHVAQTLENSIEQDRVHHAYLFCGARGVGKTSTARILAKCLNCQSGDEPTSRPCYDCKSCEDITEGQSVDVYEIDGASNRGINEIRELREGVRYAPSQGRFKIYIIDEVHMLTTEAFNALLKTLEEPPDHAYFIFATTEPQDIPITILSRCQRFDFKRISQTDIVGHLSSICEDEGLDVETEALQLIARQADGAMRDALSLLDQVIGFAGDEIDEDEVANILGVANREHLFEISRSVLERDAQGALSALDVVDRYGYDLQQFASELVTHLRDLTVTAAAKEPARVTDLTASELAEAKDQLGTMSVEGEQQRQLLHRYFSVMADGARKMKRSPYPKLIFEMTLVRLTDLEPLVELDLLLDRLEALEGEFDGTEPMPAQTGRPQQPQKQTPKSTETASQTRDRAPAETTGQDSEASADGGAPAADDDRSDDDEESDEDEVGDDGDDGSRLDGSRLDDLSAPDDGTDETDERDATEGADEEADTDDEAEEEDDNDLNLSPPDRPGPPAPGADVSDESSASGASTDEMSAPDDPNEGWRRVVERLREHRGMTGIKFEHAHPEKFADGVIELGCEDQLYTFFERSDHLGDIEEAAAELFGGEWTISIEPWEGDEQENRETLADQREAEYRQREQDLHEAVRENEAVRQAEELFDLEDDDIRIEVELDE